MLCIPLGHAGALGSAQWLIRPSRVYSPGENSYTITLGGFKPLGMFIAYLYMQFKVDRLQIIVVAKIITVLQLFISRMPKMCAIPQLVSAPLTGVESKTNLAKQIF